MKKTHESMMIKHVLDILEDDFFILKAISKTQYTIRKNAVELYKIHKINLREMNECFI